MAVTSWRAGTRRWSTTSEHPTPSLETWSREALTILMRRAEWLPTPIKSSGQARVGLLLARFLDAGHDQLAPRAAYDFNMAGALASTSTSRAGNASSPIELVQQALSANQTLQLELTKRAELLEAEIREADRLLVRNATFLGELVLIPGNRPH